jgi:dUTP pyrophosphatase
VANSIAFKRLDPRAILPQRGSEQAAGLDLFSLEPFEIKPNERLKVRTGLAVQIPVGFYGRIAPRSGLAADFGIDVLGGVVDPDYRGEIICVMINHGVESVHIGKNARIAQLIIEAIAAPKPEWSKQLDATERDAQGFGSSDTRVD